MVQVPFLDLTSSHAALKADLLGIVETALDQAAFVGGPMVSDFERDFGNFVGSHETIGVSSGTDALRLALLAMGVGPGSRVVTVPNTFIATTEAISQTGASFEFVDVDPDTCLMDPNRLADHLKRRFANPSQDARPGVIVPVHLYGQCADMDAILSIASRYDLKVLEDAAQAHGASHKGRAAGTMGHAAAFSFYPGKNLGACGEAGAVTTSDAELANKVRMLRDHGQSIKYHHLLEGYNARLDAIQAGILKVKLPHLGEWNAARRRAAAMYDQAFAETDWVNPVKVRDYNVSCYHLYVIHVPERDRLQVHLKNSGVATGLHYPVPLHRQECYRNLNLAEGAYPNAEKSAAELLSLPMFPNLTEQQIDHVTESVRSFRL